MMLPCFWGVVLPYSANLSSFSSSSLIRSLTWKQQKSSKGLAAGWQNLASFTLVAGEDAQTPKPRESPKSHILSAKPSYLTMSRISGSQRLTTMAGSCRTNHYAQSVFTLQEAL